LEKLKPTVKEKQSYLEKLKPRDLLKPTGLSLEKYSDYQMVIQNLIHLRVKEKRLKMEKNLGL